MSFDPDSFLHSTTETTMDTKYPTIPRNQYQAVIDDVDVKDGTYNKGDRAGEPWYALNVKFNILDEALREELDKEKVIVPKMIFLDMDDEGLASGRGKNIQLGRLREALGQNTGEAWSPAMMVGQMLTVDVDLQNEGADNERNDVRGYAASGN